MTGTPPGGGSLAWPAGSYNNWIMTHADEVAALFDAESNPPGRAVAELRSLGFPLGSWPYTITPQVLPRTAVDQLQRGFRAIAAGVDVLLRQRSGADQAGLIDKLRLTGAQAAVYQIATAQDWARIARPDVVWQAGRPWIVELNAGSPLGGLGISDLLVRALRACPPAAEFLLGIGAQAMDTMALLSAQIRRMDRLRRDDLLVVAYWAHEDDNMPPHFYRALAAEFRRCGINAVVAGLEELDGAGSCLTLDTRRVAGLYRFFDQSDGTNPVKDQHWQMIRRHITGGSVRLVGNLIGNVFVNKALLALLSESAGAGGMPADVAAGVRSVLPWTRLLAECRTPLGDDTVDLVRYSAEHRPELVLKPGDGWGGRDVLVGAAASQEAWEEAIGRALSAETPWVIQRFVPSAVDELVTLSGGRLRITRARSVTGAFFIDRTFAGAIRRWDDAGHYVINPTRGAGQGSAFVQLGYGGHVSGDRT